MVSRYEVTLNNVSMASLSNDLLILDVHYDPPEYSYSTYQVANRQGAGIYNKKKQSAKVRVDFEIHVYAIDQRQEVLQDVIEWCKDGGVLEINDRDGQQLVCICESLPSIDSVRDWTSPISVTFAAYDVPYWQQKTADILIIEGSNPSGSLDIAGTSSEGTYVNCTIVPTSTMTTLKVIAGGTFIELTDFSTNKSLTIGYDENNNFVIGTVDGSLLDKRTAASWDDLHVPCGVSCGFSVECDSAVQATFEVRGLWE